MTAVPADEELWKMLKSDIWSYKEEKTGDNMDFSDDDSDEIPEIDVDDSASEEEFEKEMAPVQGVDLICSECEAKFDTKEKLEKHENTHADESNYICDQCGDSFGMKKTLAAHLQRHKIEKKFECDKCHKKFDYRDNLIFHMRIHGENQNYDCDVCRRKFSSKKLLNEHKQNHLKAKEDAQRVYLLPVGKGQKGEVFATPINKPIVPIFACDVCNKKFGDKLSLENHKVIHIRHPRGPQLLIRKKKGPEPSRKYECPICAGKFHNKVTYKAHMVECRLLLQRSANSVTCSFCKKLYELPEEPMNDGPPSTKFICEPCCTLLAQKSQVSGFMPRLENRFICNKCDKCFSSEKSLREHFHSHAGEFFFSCPKCTKPKYFMTKQALRDHLLTHTEVSQSKLPEVPDIIDVGSNIVVDEYFSEESNRKEVTPSIPLRGRPSKKNLHSSSQDVGSLLCSIPSGEYTRNSHSTASQTNNSPSKARHRKTGPSNVQDIITNRKSSSNSNKKKNPITTIDISESTSVPVAELSSNSDMDDSTSNTDKIQNTTRSVRRRRPHGYSDENPYKKFHTTTSADRRSHLTKDRPVYTLNRPYRRRKTSNNCDEGSQSSENADSSMSNQSTEGTQWHDLATEVAGDTSTDNRLMNRDHTKSTYLNLKHNIYTSDLKEEDKYVDIELPDYSSDDSNDDTSDEELKECDVFIKREVDSDIEEKFNVLGNCTVFTPAFSKGGIGFGYSIPDIVIKEEQPDKVIKPEEIPIIPDKAIKQEPEREVDVSSFPIKQEKLYDGYGDVETVKEEMEMGVDFFNHPIKEEKQD